MRKARVEPPSYGKWGRRASSKRHSCGYTCGHTLWVHVMKKKQKRQQQKQKRAEWLKLRISRSERRKIEAAAKDSGLSIFDFSRRRITGTPHPNARKPKYGTADDSSSHVDLRDHSACPAIVIAMTV